MTAWEHLSESNEHFTPEYILDAARVALGGTIHLDPASSPEANARVKAKRFYTERDDFYAMSWACPTMLLNPPGGLCDRNFRRVIRKNGDTPPCTVTGACGLMPGHTHQEVESSAKRWWFRLAQEYRLRAVKRAIFIGFSLEMLQTMQVDTPEDLTLRGTSLGARTLPTPLDFPLCFPRTRIPYDKFAGGEITKGSSPPHASFIAFLSGVESERAQRSSDERARRPQGRRGAHPQGDRVHRHALEALQARHDGRAGGRRPSDREWLVLSPLLAPHVLGRAPGPRALAAQHGS